MVRIPLCLCSFIGTVGNGAREEALSQVERDHVCFAAGDFLLVFQQEVGMFRLDEGLS